MKVAADAEGIILAVGEILAASIALPELISRTLMVAKWRSAFISGLTPCND